MIVLTYRDLLGLLQEPFPFSLHELCLGYIFSFYLCNEPLASSCFDKKHDLLSSFLASLVMEKLWVDLILRYHTRQFHFAQDGRTTYWRTSDSLSQTNPASTLKPQHHYYQALFLTHHYLLRGPFQCKQNCSRDSQTTHREKISLCRTGSLAGYVLFDTHSIFPQDEFLVYGNMLFWRINSFELAHQILSNGSNFVKSISIRVVKII